MSDPFNRRDKVCKTLFCFLLLLQGVPYPENEINAVDVVVQYAIHRLGFQLEDITLFAWSIGGYSASLAAERYPDIGAVVSVLLYS